MLAAPDGHAKNFSIRILPQGRYALTPLYDVMSIWPVEGNGPNQFSMFKAKMAMAVLGKNKHYHFKDINVGTSTTWRPSASAAEMQSPYRGQFWSRFLMPSKQWVAAYLQAFLMCLPNIFTGSKTLRRATGCHGKGLIASWSKTTVGSVSTRAHQIGSA